MNQNFALTVWKLFLSRIVTWSYNYLLRIIIIGSMKLYNGLEIIGVR